MLRNGILQHGAAAFEPREGLRCKSLGYSTSRWIGVRQDCIRHQSLFCNAGNSGVFYNKDNVAGGAELKEGDMSVYKVEFVNGLVNPKSRVRVARRLTLVVGTSKYNGDPVPSRSLHRRHFIALQCQTRTGGGLELKRHKELANKTTAKSIPQPVLDKGRTKR